MKFTFCNRYESLSALELAAMPLSKMKKAVDEQETQFRANQRIGVKARELICLLLQGHELILTVSPAGRRFFTCAGQKITPDAVDQLVWRGWLKEVYEPHDLKR